MPKAQASEQETTLLRALAADPAKASATKRATYDLMAHDLTIADVCDALWHWIVVSAHPDDPHAPNRGSPS